MNDNENNLDGTNDYSSNISDENKISENSKLSGKIIKKFKNKKIKAKQNSTGKKELHFGIGSITLVCFCSFLIVVSTFLQLNVTHLIIPLKFFKGDICSIEDFIFSIKYIPQIPVIMFIAGLLGRKFGTLSIVLYILAGIFVLPVFALGGGISYVAEYSFGYILAFIPAVIVAGFILKKDYSYKNIAKASLFAVLLIHVIGIIYMTGLAYFRHAGLDFVANWISAQSGIKIIYDFMFSFLAIFITKYLRIILWFYL